jgi:hypothetical protein
LLPPRRLWNLAASAAVADNYIVTTEAGALDVDLGNGRCADALMKPQVHAERGDPEGQTFARARTRSRLILTSAGAADR